MGRRGSHSCGSALGWGQRQLWLGSRESETTAGPITQQKNPHATLPGNAPSVGNVAPAKTPGVTTFIQHPAPAFPCSQIFSCLAIHRLRARRRILGPNARGPRTGLAGRGGRGGRAARAVRGPLRLPAPRQEAGSGRGAGQAGGSGWCVGLRGWAGQGGLGGGRGGPGRTEVGCAGRVPSPPSRWCPGEAAAAGRGAFSFPGRRRGLLGSCRVAGGTPRGSDGPGRAVRGV